MRFGTALKVGALVLAVFVVTLIAVAKSIDVNQYRALIAEQAKAATGREVRINGGLQLKLGLTPKVVAEYLELANLPGGSPQPMAMIRRVEADIGLLPLLSRRVQVRRLTILRPEILLETNAAGQRNWNFVTGGPAAEVPTPPTVFAMREVRVKDARILWRDGRGGRDRVLEVPSLTIDAEGLKNPVGATATARLDGRPIEATAALGSLAEAQSQTKPFPVKFKLGSGDLVLVADGTVADLTSGAGADIKLSLQGTEVAEAARLAGYELPALGPFRAAARLSEAQGQWHLDEIDAALGRKETVMATVRGAVADPWTIRGLDLAIGLETDLLPRLDSMAGTDLPQIGPVRLAGHLSDPPGAWRLAELKAQFGKSDLAGDVTLTQGGRRPALSGRLSATLLDFDDLPQQGRAPDKAGGEKTGGEKADKAPRRADGRVIPNEPLTFDGLRRADLDVTVKVARLLAYGLTAEQAEARIVLQDGKLAVTGLQTKIGGGTIGGAFSVDAAGRPATLAASLAADKVELGGLLRDLKLTTAVQGGRSDLRADLKSSGNSLREVLAKLNGEVTLAAGKTLLTGLGGLLPTTDDMHLAAPWTEPGGDTQMQCLVGHVVVTNGLARSDAFLFDTSRVTVGGRGSVNLASELLDLTLVPRFKEASLLASAAALDVAGSFAKPTVTAEKPVMVKGVAPGMALPPFVGPAGLMAPPVAGDGDTAPCFDALSQARRPVKGKAAR